MTSYDHPSYLLHKHILKVICIDDTNTIFYDVNPHLITLLFQPEHRIVKFVGWRVTWELLSKTKNDISRISSFIVPTYDKIATYSPYIREYVL